MVSGRGIGGVTTPTGYREAYRLLYATGNNTVTAGHKVRLFTTYPTCTRVLYTARTIKGGRGRVCIVSLIRQRSLVPLLAWAILERCRRYGGLACG